ncbi:MAG: hypothetical protein HQM00_14145 [Magnetococcales bacterium]|nr:hypothetical protein [Magnetococcales bacterium]
MSGWMRIVLGGLVLGSVFSGMAWAGEESHSGQALQDAGQASGFASRALMHGIVSAGQATSAVTAVPLSVGGLVSGAAGAASATIAADSQQAASAPVDAAPLPVTEEVITILAPDEALKAPDARQGAPKKP